jgi:squalene-associated FAD-dependent desaturase
VIPRHAPQVAIVGGGWAGLAAAVTLVAHGAHVTLLEASRHVGGRARRVVLEGVDLDNGQHILIGAYSETMRLMRMVGADPDRLLARFPFELRMASGFRLRAAKLPAPWHFAAGLLRAKGIGWRARASAARLLAVHRRGNYRLPSDESVSAWLQRSRQSTAVCQALWNPLCTAALNTPVAHASAQVFLNVLRDTIEGGRAASDLLLPRADLGALFPEPAAQFVASRGGTVRVGMPARSIALAGDGFQIDGRDERYTHVVVACSPQHLAPIVRGLPQLESLVARVERFDYEPIYTCYLQYREDVSLPFPMIGFSGGLLQWVFDRGALSGHRGLIACVISGSGEHEALSQAELIVALHRELALNLPGLAPPRWSRIIAEKRATFSCRPGLDRPGNETPIPRLVLAGDYTASDYPATLETAARSGVAAARLVLDQR